MLQFFHYRTGNYELLYGFPKLIDSIIKKEEFGVYGETLDNLLVHYINILSGNKNTYLSDYLDKLIGKFDSSIKEKYLSFRIYEFIEKYKNVYGKKEVDISEYNSELVLV